MFRAASRLPRRTLASVTVGGVAGSLVSTNDKDTEKLPIYPTETPQILLADDPSALETQIGVLRRQAIGTLRQGHAQVQSWVDKWIGVEHAVENRVKSIISPSEPLTPNLLYVGVATLTGSILGRNRILLTRLVLPPAFLVLSAHHFLPKTTKNLSDYLGSVEETYFPTLAEKHDIANAHTRMTWEGVKEGTKDGRAKLDKGAGKVVDKLQELTGLRFRETLGWSGQSKKVEPEPSKAAEKIAKEVVEIPAATVEKVEKKADEVKRIV